MRTAAATLFCVLTAQTHAQDRMCDRQLVVQGPGGKDKTELVERCTHPDERPARTSGEKDKMLHPRSRSERNVTRERADRGDRSTPLLRPQM